MVQQSAPPGNWDEDPDGASILLATGRARHDLLVIAEPAFLRDLDQQKVKGYDHSFLLGEASSDTSTGAVLRLAAELRSADSRVSLQVHTDQPALHLYTGQYLGGTEKRDGSHYADLAGVALESQFPPDSPSHGRAILLPGQTYRRTTRFAFRF